MQIVIVGAGRMGFSLARRLDSEGHRIFLLDRDADAVERARNRLDVMAVVGSGSSLKSLREVGAQDADLLIATSGSDEVNMVSSLLARQLGVPRRICRVESEELLSDLREADQEVLGVSEFVHPIRIAVDRLQRMVLSPGTTESAEFLGGEVVLRALQTDEHSRLVQAPLAELGGECAEEFRIVAVRRKGELSVPTGDFQIRAGDVIYVVTRAGHVQPFLKAYGLRPRKPHRVFIFGAHDIGCGLAEALEGTVTDVLLIDPNPECCMRASDRLSHTSVICGSPLDQALMEDLRLEGADYFLGLSPDDPANLAGALLAQRRGARSALMMTGEPDAVQHFEALPLNAVVCPLLLSVGAILRSVRAGDVISLFSLAADRGEALEIRVADGASPADKPLREVAFPGGALVAAVIGEQGVEIASGDTVIRGGDRVVVVALRKTIPAVMRLFTEPA